MIENFAFLVNAIRAAEIAGPGVALQGKAFVDLLCSTATINVSGSTNEQFRVGGIEATSAPSGAANAAFSALTGTNSGWTGYTIATQLTAAAIADAAENCTHVRMTWRAGTSGGLTLHGAFIGVHLASSAGDFDPAYPVVPLHFSGATSGSATAGNTLVSDVAAFSIPPGKALYVKYYVSAGGNVATSTATGWTSFYKVANEPAKLSVSGYSNTSTILGLERIEYLNTAFSNLDVSSVRLPLSAAPASVDMVVVAECAPADVGDIGILLSRDGATWNGVTASFSTLFTTNGKVHLGASGIDVTASTGTGNALYWRVVTFNNKRVRVNAVALLQDQGFFTDVPSVSMRRSAEVLTRHAAATGLGYKPSSFVIYGQLWGFTQDWEVTGPTRFFIRFHAQLVHTGLPSASVPVAWTLALTSTYGATLGALGPKVYDETDSGTIGNNSSNWICFSSGNIADLDEHYKEGFITLEYVVETPGAYRFQIWGYSATTADSPLQPDRIALNWEEAYGASLNGIAYNALRIAKETAR